MKPNPFPHLRALQTAFSSVDPTWGSFVLRGPEDKTIELTRERADYAVCAINEQAELADLLKRAANCLQDYAAKEGNMNDGLAMEIEAKLETLA